MKYKIIKNEGPLLEIKDSGIESLGLKIGDEIEAKNLTGNTVLCEKTKNGKMVAVIYRWNLEKINK